MSITLHAATQARRLLALTAAGLPSRSESHPMDHDSNSSGHTESQDLTPCSIPALAAADLITDDVIVFNV